MKASSRIALAFVLIGLAIIAVQLARLTSRVADLDARLNALEEAKAPPNETRTQDEEPTKGSGSPDGSVHRTAEAKAEGKGTEQAPPPARTEEQLQTFRGSISKKGLCGAFEKLGKKGDVICAHVARVLRWKLDLRRDLRKGDRIAVVYGWLRDENEPVVEAIEFEGKVRVRAYRFRAGGDPYASYFDEQGMEIPARLVNSPIDGYEQITAFFGDRRGRKRHLGIDFKAPVGTPVRSPFDGVVVRKNWNWRNNGNCIEIKVDGEEMYAIFLHLDKLKVGAGDRVKKGDVIAASGNTGRTTAPHLHYQLDRVVRGRRKPIDPLKYHRLYRKKLEGEELDRFRARAKELQTLMR